MLMLAAPTGECMLPAPKRQIRKGKLQTEFALSNKALVKGFRRAVEGLRRGPERLAYIKRRWEEIKAADLPKLDGGNKAVEAAVGGMEDDDNVE